MLQYDVCCVYFYFFFFKQKTAYEMRISDWSSDVCSSDLEREERGRRRRDDVGDADDKPRRPPRRSRSRDGPDGDHPLLRDAKQQPRMCVCIVVVIMACYCMCAIASTCILYVCHCKHLCIVFV